MLFSTFLGDLGHSVQGPGKGLPHSLLHSFFHSADPGGPKGHGRLHSLMQHKFTKDYPTLALIHLCCSCCPRILAFSGITEYNSFVPGTSMHACNAHTQEVGESWAFCVLVMQCKSSTNELYSQTCFFFFFETQAGLELAI